eukprot:4464735-Amphidinium_carterae.1
MDILYAHTYTTGDRGSVWGIDALGDHVHSSLHTFVQSAGSLYRPFNVPGNGSCAQPTDACPIPVPSGGSTTHGADTKLQAPNSIQDCTLGQLLAAPRLRPPQANRGRHGMRGDRRDREYPCSILSLNIRSLAEQVHCINVHAPIAEAPQADHDNFASQLDLVVQQADNHGHIVVCGDLNARFGNVESSAMGFNAISVCPNLASHRRSALALLEHRNLFAANTFMGRPDDFTWTHTSGSMHQIDYIFLDQRMLDVVTTLEVGEWGEFDLTTTSDHRSIKVVLELGKTVRFKGPQKRVRFQSDKHKADIMEAVNHGVLGTWDPSVAPE